MNPVLVIGGCGGLGYHIVKQLIEEGHAKHVTVFDVDISRNTIEHPALNYVRGSLREEEDVKSIVQSVKPKVIFHVASPHNMNSEDKRLFDSVNVDGTQYLLNALKVLSNEASPAAARLLVFTSSSSVIHDNSSNLLNANEDLPYCLAPKQTQYYSHTKALAEQMVLAANQPSKLMTAAIRACTLFGEGDNTMTPQMIANARAGRTKIRIGDGKNIYDFGYLGNTAYAHILCAKALVREDEALRGKGLSESDTGKKVNGEAFFITNDEPWPFWDMPLAMSAALGRPFDKKKVRQIPIPVYFAMMVVMEWAVWLVSLGQRRSQFNRRMVPLLTVSRTFDISKAKERLGYRPRVGMQEAVQRSVDWFLKQEHAAAGSPPAVKV